ncbi:S-layer homology domain-containing protein [Oscillibacter sp.]|uniref:S-layer homology domain-containing protein n=1 Tax=Oscillibacter sp. TaxID=1945593 RepID=UPI0033971708
MRRVEDTSAWYCGYVKTAIYYGIIKGYGSRNFGPSDTITRAEVAVMVQRLLQKSALI